MVGDDAWLWEFDTDGRNVLGQRLSGYSTEQRKEVCIQVWHGDGLSRQ